MNSPASVSRSITSLVSGDAIDLLQIFQGEHSWELRRCFRTQDAERQERLGHNGDRMLLDRFASVDASCCFLRLTAAHPRTVSLELPGSYHIQSCPGGGWVVEPEGAKNCSYWVPQPIMLRTVSQAGHILNDRAGQFSSLKLAGRLLSIGLLIPAGYYSDVVIWQIPFEDNELLQELMQLAPLEAQGIFLWGSHTTYHKPADLYSHLIFGSVYERRYAWPYKQRICSENDAHSLYVTFNGLERAARKKVYTLFKQQLLLSVMARQAEDGGWHHGEWTEDMEAHLRLNGSAIHLLLDAFEERRDPAIRQALVRAVEFVSRHRDETAVGTWFLHDSLELTVEGMNKSPFHWRSSRVLGKSPSNMLVLNTHLDSLVLLDRYQHVTGDRSYSGLIQSAKSATRAVLNLRSLDSLYGLLFNLIRLTLLPTRAQQSLPLPLRALKRLAWQWLSPNLYRLTALFPRLVMPGGYIERAIGIRGLADDYHSVNVMDLARYWRRFPCENLQDLLCNAVKFVQNDSIQDYWKDREEKRYALGFWAEALYHLYLLAPNHEKLSYLADTILKLDDIDVGLPPSLLGGNAEVVASDSQVGCLSLSDEFLRVANLSRTDCEEFLIINPTREPRAVAWENSPTPRLTWLSDSGVRFGSEKCPEVPARGWIVGCKDAGA